jgi:hypothetical protein
MYDTLFEATWETLQIWQNKEVQMGMIRFCTRQQLSLHPHLHCIVRRRSGQEEQWRKWRMKTHKDTDNFLVTVGR